MLKTFRTLGISASIMLLVSACAGSVSWAKSASPEDIRAATDFELCSVYRSYEINPAIKTEILKRGLLDEQEWDDLVKNDYGYIGLGSKKCQAFSTWAFWKQESQDEDAGNMIEIWGLAGCEPLWTTLGACGYTEYTFQNGSVVDIKCYLSVSERCHDSGLLSADDTDHLKTSEAYSAVRISAAESYALDTSGIDAESMAIFDTAPANYPDGAWASNRANEIGRLLANRHFGPAGSPAPGSGAALDIKLVRISYTISEAGSLTCADAQVQVTAGDVSSTASAGCDIHYGNAINSQFLQKTQTDPRTISVQRYMYALYYVAVNRAELNALNELLDKVQ
jgi:hypothetical protein